MQFVVTGMREMARKLDRLKNRIALIFEKRRLKKAEINLGFLGWQQAEFFSPELEAQVQQIMHFEKNQADLANRSAEIAGKIGVLKNEREKQRQLLADFLFENAVEAKPFASEREALQQKIDERRCAAANFRQACSELDSEDRKCGATLKELNDSSSDTFVVRNEILRLRDRRIVLADQKMEVELGLGHSLSEVNTAEKNLSAVGEQLAKVRRKADEKREEFNERDRDLRSQIDTLEREKSKTEKEAETLDRRKTDPYLLIGQALATSDIAPANQPDALDRVRRHRAIADGLEDRIATLASESAQVNRRDVVAFYVCLIALALVVIFVRLFANFAV